MAQPIYLDNNTITRPSDQAVAKMLSLLSERWGAPSAPHRLGQQLFPAIEDALRALYALLGANESDTILFTSSTAEGINHAILAAYFDVTIPTGKNQFISSALDDAPSIMAIDRLEQLSCLGKTALADQHGKITAQAIADNMSPRTALVSVPWVNGLTGVVNPIEEIYALCQERGALLLVDGSHAVGKLFCEWKDVPAHFLTFSGDSFHAPSGTGGLFIKSGVKCSPFILGGIEQGAMRAGNYSVAALVAMGQAAKEAIDAKDFLYTETARLRTKLEDGLLTELPTATTFFRHEERLPNCTAMAFPGVSNEALLFLLNRKGVYASIGGGTSPQIRLILEASGVAPELAQSSINFSLSRETTEDEIERAIAIIVASVKQLQRISTVKE